jgi:hypothetical protein
MQPSAPFTPPPPTVSYLVSVNGEGAQEFLAAPNASKLVADNLAVGYPSVVAFRNAKSIETVLSKFNERIDGWLRQVGHTAGFRVTPTATGAEFSPPY